MKFEETGLRGELLQALAEQGHQQPTPIQEKAIPEVLAGRDLIACAQTGTGKTAAFALPILHRLAETPRADIRALVLVPTRELALQVTKSLQEYGAHLEIVASAVFGGVPIAPQERALRMGVDILVATPGRLKDHIWRGNIDFRHTAYLVLDEADRMLDMGFIKAVQEIVELLPEERQSMLFSATLDDEIRRFSRGILRNPLRIEVAPPSSTIEEVDQFLVRTSRQRKRSMLESLIDREHMSRAIVFARTKSGASRLASDLRQSGHNASAIHSDRSQAERIRALEGFREGRIQILVATDIAARGIDVDDVSHVVNFDLPHTAKDYVHRIGRTARAGRRGRAISLVTPEDSAGVASIERLIAKKLDWLGERPAESARGFADEPRGRNDRSVEGEPALRAHGGNGRRDGAHRGGSRARGRTASAEEARRARRRPADPEEAPRARRRTADPDEARRAPPRESARERSPRRPGESERPARSRRSAASATHRRRNGEAVPARRNGEREPAAARKARPGSSRRSKVLLGYHQRSRAEDSGERGQVESTGLKKVVRSLTSRLFS